MTRYLSLLARFAATSVLLAGCYVPSYSQAPTPMGRLPIAELQQLANSGDPAAENELGVRYKLGRDVDKDPAQAIPWFLKAAQQGYAKAYFNLGAAYYNGDGVPVNDQNYCAWFLFSADAGDERGRQALLRAREEMAASEIRRCETLAATAYLTGDLIKQDNEKAMKWFVAAANAGDGAACEKIAYLYDRGVGVAPNKQESLKWLERAANLNYAPAVYELGMAYEAGNNVPVDFAKARKFYEQASILAFPQAFGALGNMYSDGRGVKRDQEKALAYYLVAAHNGDADVKRKRDELLAQLSTKQVAAAKQEAAKLVSATKGPVLLLHR